MEAVIPRRFDERTPVYLTAALRRAGVLGGGRVVERRIEELGFGRCFVGEIGRIHLRDGREGVPGPGSVVVKRPGQDRRHRALAGLGQGHELEVRFYRAHARD